MPATGYQIITATTLRTGLGPYMHPNVPPFISSYYEIDASHGDMFTAPEALAALLQKIASERT